MAWQVYVWSKHNPFIHMSFLGLFTFTAAYLPWVNVLLPCFLECQINLPDLKFELFLSDHIFMKPIIFLMLLCLNVPWHDKCAILLVAHPYMYAREMQYLVACFFFKKNILLYLEGPHDINLTFIIFSSIFLFAMVKIYAGVIWTCGVQMFFHQLECFASFVMKY